MTFPINSFGQEVPIEKRFNDIFSRETNAPAKKSSDSSQLEIIKSIFPDKFVNDACNNSMLSIGISDPNLDSLMGYRQAYYRALMLAALQQKSSVKMLSENFASQKETTKDVKSRYQEMYRISSLVSLSDSLPIAASFRLKSGETLVLVKLPPTWKSFPDSDQSTLPASPSKSADSKPTASISKIGKPGVDQNKNIDLQHNKNVVLKVNCNLYHLEDIANGSLRIYRSEYEICTTNSMCENIAHDKFCFTIMNDFWCDFKTSFNGKEIVKPEIRYLYYLKDAEAPTDSLVSNSIGMPASEGLWPALITSVLWQITGLSSDHNATIKQVSDYYGQNVINLTSTVQNKSLQFKLLKLVLNSNRLYSVLNIEKVDFEKK
jgi:hypothetical protein